MITVNFKTRTARNGKQLIIDKGKPINGYVIPDTTSIEQLNKLYHNYKYSVPNGLHYHKPYFKALSPEEISNTDMITGSNREHSKEALELAVLEGIINGSLQELFIDPRQWFWQSPDDKDFIILKDWIEPSQELNNGCN